MWYPLLRNSNLDPGGEKKTVCEWEIQSRTRDSESLAILSQRLSRWKRAQSVSVTTGTRERSHKSVLAELSMGYASGHGSVTEPQINPCFILVRTYVRHIQDSVFHHKITKWTIQSGDQVLKTERNWNKQWTSHFWLGSGLLMIYGGVSPSPGFLILQKGRV